MKVGEFITWVIICIAGFFSCIWLYNTFTRHGYQYGDVATYSSDLKFNIYMETLVLTEDKDNPNKYEFETQFNSTYQVCPDFDASKKDYMLQLNKECFATTAIEYGYAECALDFTFLDTRGNELMTDTLYINIEFYLGSTDMYIYTLGGYEAVTYWNYLFDSMHFDLRVYEIGDKAIENTTNTVVYNMATTTAETAVA